MIIGMRGHDFGRMEPDRLAEAIASHGFRATQLAFGKAFVQSPETYMTDEKLAAIRATIARQIQVQAEDLSVSEFRELSDSLSSVVRILSSL